MIIGTEYSKKIVDSVLRFENRPQRKPQPQPQQKPQREPQLKNRNSEDPSRTIEEPQTLL